MGTGGIVMGVGGIMTGADLNSMGAHAKAGAHGMTISYKTWTYK